MQSEDFQCWLSQIKHLTEQRQVVGTLTHQADRTVMAGLLEPVSQCPHYASPSIGHWGNRDGLPRYRCKACRKTFNALTATPLARLRHKTLWPKYAETMIDSVSVRKAARSVRRHR
jgi:transposase-like protein